MLPSVEPKVSVVMSVYNGARFLREAVRSILDQTFTDFEFIIIDDGSTDTTPKILKELDDPRIKIIVNEKNEGLTRSLIKGCNAARGKYIARMDADDVSDPRRFQRQVEFLDSNPDCSLVGSQCFFLDDKGKKRAVSSYFCSDEDIKRDIWSRTPFAHGSTMFIRNDFEELGGYRELFRFSQDCDLWSRIIQKHKAANLPDALYGLRYHLKSLSLKTLHLQSKFAELAREFARVRADTGSDPIMRGDREEVRMIIESWTPNGLLEKRRINSDSALQVLHFMAPWARVSDITILLATALFSNPANKRAWQFLLRGPLWSRLHNSVKYRLHSKGIQ